MKNLNETNVTKSDVKKIVDDELKAAIKKMEAKFMAEKEVREMIRTSLIAHYKTLWQKASFFVQ